MPANLAKVPSQQGTMRTIRFQKGEKHVHQLKKQKGKAWFLCFYKYI